MNQGILDETAVSDDRSRRLSCARGIRCHRSQIIDHVTPRLRDLAEPYRVLPEPLVRATLWDYLSVMADAIDQGNISPLESFLDQPDDRWALSGLDASQALRGLFLVSDVCQTVLANAAGNQEPSLIERYTREVVVLTSKRSVLMADRLAMEAEHHRAYAARMMSLQRVSGVVSSELDLDLTLDVIVQEALGLMQASAAAIQLIDEGTQTLRMIACAGNVESLMHSEHISVEGTLAGHCFRTRSPVIGNDVRHDLRLSEEIRQTSKLRSLLIVPLKVRDCPIGVLLVSDREGSVFTTDDQQLLGLFADQVSNAIEHARLFGQAQSRIAELAALHRISSVILSSLDINEVFQAIYEEIRHVVTTDAFVISLRRPDGLFDVEFIMDGGQRYEPRHAFSINPALMQAITTRRPVIIADSQELVSTPMNTVGHPQTQVRSLLAVPLLKGNEVVGLLSAQSYTPHVYSESDAHLLMTIANHAVVAIEHARLYGEAQNLAIAEERNRLARELHDTLAQGLVSVILYLERMDLLLPESDHPARNLLDRTLRLVRRNLDEARRSVRDLRAAPLEGRSLTEALQYLADELNGEGHFSVQLSTPTTLPMLAARVETALFRMVQEAATNCQKHAHCTNLAIDITVTEEILRLDVVDDGRGFDTTRDSTVHSRFGLSSMRERITEIGGSFELKSEPNQGTTIRASIPLDRAVHTESEHPG